MAKKRVTLIAAEKKVIWAYCVNDDNKPIDYHGDWPEEGKLYQVEVFPHFETGHLHVHVIGFTAQKPWGAFALYRFAQAVTYWLN